MTDMLIRRAAAADRAEWVRLRLLLWSDNTPEVFSAEIDAFLADPLAACFVAVRADGRLGGFLEVGLRKYADGCETTPVGYIEGWYVDEDLRQQGVGGRLVRAAEVWARGLGCAEMASDTWLWNETSIHAHLALGYEEKERLVHFAKKL
jgi:aminoglycoside 6'-N-acetyltransferase I